ncbi:hypothetical protein C4D60_Mb05t23330 [Musa balbisiana]|uniref:Uncharacterized protein n=1 Tax=Musa balbisiana TaxID=52838 RepID=A0A4S8JYB2_MUSBA|nr:hypothetical protein C4D60_Mb05t23330 [Musa balbisiana]
MVAEGVRMEADEKCQKAVELFLPGSRGLEGKYVREKHARRRIQLSNDAAKEYEEDPKQHGCAWSTLQSKHARASQQLGRNRRPTLSKTLIKENPWRRDDKNSGNIASLVAYKFTPN